VAAFGVIPAVILFPLYDPGGEVFFTPSRIGLYAYLIAALPVLYRLTRDTGPDRIAGDLSYPVYLCHLIPVQLIQGSGTLAPHAAVRAALVVAASVALAAVATWLVEIPIDKFRQSRLRHRAAVNRLAGESVRSSAGSGTTTVAGKVAP
jgi:peptidoglycan/LPS O-acetylase OafA/YrhL